MNTRLSPISMNRLRMLPPLVLPGAVARGGVEVDMATPMA